MKKTYNTTAVLKRLSGLNVKLLVCIHKGNYQNLTYLSDTKLFYKIDLHNFSSIPSLNK